MTEDTHSISIKKGTKQTKHLSLHRAKFLLRNIKLICYGTIIQTFPILFRGLVAQLFHAHLLLSFIYICLLHGKSNAVKVCLVQGANISYAHCLLCDYPSFLQGLNQSMYCPLMYFVSLRFLQHSRGSLHKVNYNLLKLSDHQEFLWLRREGYKSSADLLIW